MRRLARKAIAHKGGGVALSEHRDGALAEFDQALDTRDSSLAHRVLSGMPVRVADPWFAKRSNWLRVSQQLSLAGLALFVATVLALHGLRRDVNPAEHTISEYSLGAYGWLMRAAFAALGCGVLATAESLRLRFEPSSWWRLGLLLLALTAVGLFLDAGYNTDHPRVPETFDGTVHGLGMLIVCLTLPAASFLLGSALTRSSVAAQARWLQLLAAGQLVAILGFEVSPAALRGLIERTAIAMAIAAVALMQSAARSPTRPSGTEDRGPFTP
jgi:hypothetical protein